MRTAQGRHVPDPVPVGDIARKLLREKKFHQKGRFTELTREWKELVGAPVADKTRIRSFKDGKLVISVVSPSLLHELNNFMRDSLLQALQETKAGRDIASIRFRLSDDPNRETS